MNKETKILQLKEKMDKLKSATNKEEKEIARDEIINFLKSFTYEKLKVEAANTSIQFLENDINLYINSEIPFELTTLNDLTLPISIIHLSV